MSRDTSADTTLDGANMGTSEEFRKWWDESGIEFPSIFESGAAQKGWNARQPEIDALTSELQGEMIKVAAQEAIAEALKKLVAVRDKSIESLKAENELNLAANRGLGRLVDVLQAENERLQTGNSTITERNHELWLKCQDTLVEVMQLRKDAERFRKFFETGDTQRAIRMRKEILYRMQDMNYEEACFEIDSAMKDFSTT